VTHDVFDRVLLAHRVARGIQLHHDETSLHVSVAVPAHVRIHVDAREMCGWQVAHEKEHHRGGAEHHLQALKTKLIKVVLDLDHLDLVWAASLREELQHLLGVDETAQAEDELFYSDAEAS
jgi:hypothetical protein